MMSGGTLITNCCGVKLVTNSQYSGNSDRMPASVRSTYTSRRTGSWKSRGMAPPRTSTGRAASSLVLDIATQPTELNHRHDDSHDEQHDRLGARHAVASELERRAVNQLDDGDGGVVWSAAVGHDVDALEDLEGGDRIDDDQVEGGWLE